MINNGTVKDTCSSHIFFSFRGVKLIIILYNKVTGSATISKWQLHQQFFFGI